jgi:hypothetical protein
MASAADGQRDAAEPVWSFREASMALRAQQDAQAAGGMAPPTAYVSSGGGSPGAYFSAWDGKQGVSPQERFAQNVGMALAGPPALGMVAVATSPALIPASFAKYLPYIGGGLGFAGDAGNQHYQWKIGDSGEPFEWNWKQSAAAGAISGLTTRVGMVPGLNNPFGVAGLGFVNNAAKTEFNNQFFGENDDWIKSGAYGAGTALLGYGLGSGLMYGQSKMLARYNHPYTTYESWRKATYVSGGVLMMPTYRSSSDFLTPVTLTTGFAADWVQPKYEK